MSNENVTQDQSSGQLADLITGYKSVQSHFEGGVMSEAINEMMAEKKKMLIKSAVSLVSGFIRTANSVEAEALEAQKRADVAKATSKGVKKALAYFQATGIPLPFYAATFNKEAGIQWCKSNGLEVPSANSNLWSVPEGFGG